MVTILMPVSRAEYLDIVFAGLEFLDCDRRTTNLICIVDGDTELFVNVRNRVENSKFAERLAVQYKSDEPMKNYNVLRRRKRIASLHEELKKYIQKCDYIWCIEDDGQFNSTALKRLLYHYTVLPYAGLISGVELGRHGISCVGGWKVDNVYEPKEIKSVDLEKGLIELDATGLYCALIKSENYLKHTFEPYEDVLGPDFNLGLSLRRQGLINYMDFGVKVTHLTKDGNLEVKHDNIQRVTFIKKEHGWEQRSV